MQFCCKEIFYPILGITKIGHYFYFMIGKQLKQMRITKELSVYRLSLNAKVKQGIIANIEKGESATLTTLEKLAKALDCEITLTPKK